MNYHFAWFTFHAYLCARVVGQTVTQPAPVATKLCPDYMNCLSPCGARTECYLVTCCSTAPVPTCLNHARYCASPTTKTTKKCRKSSECPVNVSGATQSVCCLTADSQDGFCAEIPCSALCPSIVPGYQAQPPADTVLPAAPSNSAAPTYSTAPQN